MISVLEATGYVFVWRWQFIEVSPLLKSASQSLSGSGSKAGEGLQLRLGAIAFRNYYAAYISIEQQQAQTGWVPSRWARHLGREEPGSGSPGWVILQGGQHIRKPLERGALAVRADVPATL
jgi:hypothetical protein